MREREGDRGNERLSSEMSMETADLLSLNILNNCLLQPLDQVRVLKGFLYLHLERETQYNSHPMVVYCVNGDVV